MPLKCKKCGRTHTASRGCPTEWTLWRKQFVDAKKCLFPVTEFAHKVACREPATHKSLDNAPACKRHQNFNMKQEWKGFIQGA